MTDAAAKIGQIVYFYNHNNTFAMSSLDDEDPFAAVVAGVQPAPVAPTPPAPLVPPPAPAAGVAAHAPKPAAPPKAPPPLVNLLVIDHTGKTFAMQSVPLFAAGDEDADKGPCHCGTEPPPPKKVIAVSGVAGQPIALNIPSSPELVSETLKFTVPPGQTYTFVSTKGAINQAFSAAPKAQSLSITSAEVTAGALTDLSIEVAIADTILLAVTAVDKGGKTSRFNESVVVAAAPPVPAAAAA